MLATQLHKFARLQFLLARVRKYFCKNLINWIYLHPIFPWQCFWHNTLDHKIFTQKFRVPTSDYSLFHRDIMLLKKVTRVCVSRACVYTHYVYLGFLCPSAYPEACVFLTRFSDKNCVLLGEMLLSILVDMEKMCK